MTLVISKGITLRKGYIGTDDPDAEAYIAAVEAADEAESPGVGALETATKVAIHSFVKGCKADGIWPAIKASCILAGARTLAGALVPLAGTAPSNNNFASGDYNRKTGLLGNGSSKHLDSNRLCSLDGQDNVHASVYVSTRDVGQGRYLSGTGTSATSTLALIGNTTGFRARVQSSVINTHSSNTAVPAFLGVSRAASASYSWRDDSSSGSQAVNSAGVSPGNYFVFATNNPGNYTDARIAFYSIGSSLDLTSLSTRVTALYNAFAAAIP